MRRKPETIISDIKKLLIELENSLAPSGAYKETSVRPTKASTVPKGALGAITLLMEEDFFDTPKEISAVMEKLKEIGHYHKLTTVAMNLLNLTKRRILNRFKNKETKNWEYVKRR